MDVRPHPFKYEQLADEMAELIRSGTFRPGDRIPSIRQMSRRKQVSVSTVMQAYCALEARGLIETRPRSGIFVRTALPRLMPEPRISSPEPDPARVTVEEMVRMIILDAFNPDLVPLGAAYPSPDLMATGKLARLQAAIARRKGEKSGMYALPPQGALPLRVQIAQRAAAVGCRIRPDELVLTTGCAEAVSLCLRAACRPGDIVAIESPICFDVLQCIEALELRALEIPTHPRNGIRLETLEFAIEHNPVRACIVISNFNNPLGSCIPEERKQALVALLAKHEIPLIENDIFGDIHFGPDRPGICKSYDQKGLVMLCSSFSKTICPGCRVGWVAAGRLLKRIEWLKYTSTMVSATLPQLAFAEFLASGACEQHLRRIRRTYERRVAAMIQVVERSFPEGTRVTRPSGGFLLWLQLPENADAFEVYRRSLQSGIAVTPGHIFSSSDHYQDFIRLNAAHGGDGILAAVETVGRHAAAVARGSS